MTDPTLDRALAAVADARRRGVRRWWIASPDVWLELGPLRARLPDGRDGPGFEAVTFHGRPASVPLRTVLLLIPMEVA